MDVTAILVPIVTLGSEVQLQNAFFPIEVTLSGIVTLVRLRQYSNA